MLSGDNARLISLLNDFDPEDEAVEHGISIIRVGSVLVGFATAYCELRERGFRLPKSEHAYWLDKLADHDKENDFVGWQLRNQLLEDGPAPVAA